MLRAGLIIRHLEQLGLISIEPNIEVDDVTLSQQGWIYYQKVFSGSKLAERSIFPPEGCLGGLHAVPFIWLSNVMGSSGEVISMTRLKKKFEEVFAAVVIAESRRKK